MNTPPDQAPTWLAFFVAAGLCLFGCAGWMGLLWLGSSLAGWGDGAGSRGGIVLLDFFPLLSFIALGLAFLPRFRQKTADILIAVAALLYLAFLARFGHHVEYAIGAFFCGFIVIGGFYTARRAIGARRGEPS